MKGECNFQQYLAIIFAIIFRIKPPDHLTHPLDPLNPSVYRLIASLESLQDFGEFVRSSAM